MINNNAGSMQVLKETSALGRLIIKPVDKALAKELIVANHYSHKWNEGGFGKYNFGIFRAEAPDDCLGVAVYGYMKNPKAKLFTHPNPNAWMCELNRMWIDDTLGKNAESILIAASIKLLRKLAPDCVAVQSFADGRLGCGTIYKAANFRYYGFHYTKFLRNRRTGEITHEQILTNTTSPSAYLRSNIAYLIGDLEVFQVKTYRYIYPLCKRFRFNGPEKPYPQYEKGIDPVEWNRNKRKIKENIITLLDKVAA
ncbi:MAG TPA: hypothetical protein DEB64_00710 [Alistipes sp.]|uniref:Mom family adenine methylcarbamoylation protein n=1 Tax=Alistipes sp. UBA6068 TaxID=1946012 RepID=UPI000E90373A|nr:hypothetical protein [Alistipes sp. UBA6068]HBV49313.1 hypothetical protein [Alistipes sp.]